LTGLNHFQAKRMAKKIERGISKLTFSDVKLEIGEFNGVKDFIEMIDVL